MNQVKKAVLWATEAQGQLRAIDRETARRILQGVDEYLTTGIGDVKKLRSPRDELRLRIGDYRVFFYRLAPLAIRIVAVKHRSEAYR